MKTWMYYERGPYGDVYEVWTELPGAEQEPDLIGRTTDPAGMIAAAYAGDWDAVGAMQYHEPDAPAPKPHAPELQARFDVGNSVVKAQVLRSYLKERGIADERPYIQNGQLTQAGRAMLGEAVYGE